MKKYRTEFKLEVVQSFFAGEGGAKLLARRWSAHVNSANYSLPVGRARDFQQHVWDGEPAGSKLMAASG